MRDVLSPFHDRAAVGWRRGLLLATVLAGLVLPVAARAADAPTLRVAMPEDALTLDPIASSDNPSIWTELLIFDQPSARRRTAQSSSPAWRRNGRSRRTACRTPSRSATPSSPTAIR